MTQPRKLDRILRVRTLQLGLSRADEARAQARVDSEATLRTRIEQLSEGVAPAEAAASTALSFVAAAHFRDRLHQSAVAADERLRAAQAVLDRAGEARKQARRDQSAVEKLIARDDALAALKAIRALEEAPPLRKIRHDPC
ncbi:hypothetical protein ACFO8O_09855 [Hephaestia sp. GCM10023244]|uniref:hypothetical protein n=1 Tax=unclassified Hephaestia TaxID=2631281 RepID=UPI00207759C1|nr:hypothetical protein [Hephaestia sp. MAHUQ-44]MCM8731264.1 hypothetical protein [Hephaestia sp. MAHUQ-44]